MEVPSLQGLGLEHGILTKEKQKEIEQKGNSISIGLPREESNEERRVSISPSGVAVLVANGHKVLVGKGAGEGAHFSDREYAEAGGEIADSDSMLYSNSDLIEPEKCYPLRKNLL